MCLNKVPTYLPTYLPKYNTIQGYTNKSRILSPLHCFAHLQHNTYFFFCFVDVGATLREACTSLGGTGILTEFTLADGESKGIPRELLAGSPFNPLGGVDKLLSELPVCGIENKKWNQQ